MSITAVNIVQAPSKGALVTAVAAAILAGQQPAGAAWKDENDNWYWSMTAGTPLAGQVTVVPSRGTLAAAGTTAADAAVIVEQISLVTGADGAKGVALPAASSSAGPYTVVNTDDDAMLLVYPTSGGNDQINGLAEDLPIEVGPGESLTFTATSATQWYCAASKHGRNAEVVTAANTITAEESGKTFFLNAAAEFASTLPAPKKGLRYTFIVQAAPSGASYTIITGSSANIIKGQIYTLDVNSATDPDFEATGGDTISFVDAKAIAGDRIELYCDGTNWFAYGFCSVFDAITITTAS